MHLSDNLNIKKQKCNYLLQCCIDGKIMLSKLPINGMLCLLYIDYFLLRMQSKTEIKFLLLFNKTTQSFDYTIKRET